MNEAPASPFPWDLVQALGIGRLRLTPETFWAMSPCELLAMLGRAPAAAPARGDLETLMALYPDGEKHGSRPA